MRDLPRMAQRREGAARMLTADVPDVLKLQADRMLSLDPNVHRLTAYLRERERSVPPLHVSPFLLGAVTFKMTPTDGAERWTPDVLYSQAHFGGVESFDEMRARHRAAGDVVQRIDEASPDVWIRNGVMARETAAMVVRAMIIATPGHRALHDHWRRAVGGPCNVGRYQRRKVGHTRPLTSRLAWRRALCG